MFFNIKNLKFFLKILKKKKCEIEKKKKKKF